MAVAGIFLLTIVALVSNGYHLGSGDSAIYIPGVKLIANPALYPHGATFFLPHATFTLFPYLIGLSGRLLQLPSDWTIFVWYLVSLALLFAAAFDFLGACFTTERARWAGLCTLALTLATPVAGTALVLADPYLTSRSLSTPATLFALAAFARGRMRAACLWLCTVLVIHPQMGVYAAGALAFLALARWRTRLIPVFAPAPVAAAFLGIPFAFDWRPATGVYKEVLRSRPYFLVSTWQWYEWVGVVAPLLILWSYAHLRSSHVTPAFRSCCRALVYFAITLSCVAIFSASGAQFESFARFQPMRSLHLIYFVFFLFTGGLVGEYVLRGSVLRWSLLFAPLLAAMWFVQTGEFPDSRHVEIPGAAVRGSWVPALLWIRGHTPVDATFAMDPDYFTTPGVDLHGFRAIAERGALADELKDSGAVAMFPELAEQWKDEVVAQKAWRDSGYLAYRALTDNFGVRWFVIPRNTSVPGLRCPYENARLRVCTVA